MKGLKLFISFVLILIGSQGHALLRGEVKEIEIKSDPSMPIQYRLKAVLLLNSPWTEDLIVREVGRANKVFLQCGFQIGKLETFVLADKNHFENDDFEYYALDLQERGFRKGHEPIVIFSGSALQDRQKKNPSLAFAMTAPVPPEFDKNLENFIFMKSTAIPFDTRTSILAHELGHLWLGSSSHREYPNLMGTGANANNKITSDQCEAMKESNLLGLRERGQNLNPFHALKYSNKTF